MSFKRMYCVLGLLVWFDTSFIYIAMHFIPHLEHHSSRSKIHFLSNIKHSVAGSPPKYRAGSGSIHSPTLPDGDEREQRRL